MVLQPVKNDVQLSRCVGYGQWLGFKFRVVLTITINPDIMLGASPSETMVIKPAYSTCMAGRIQNLCSRVNVCACTCMFCVTKCRGLSHSLVMCIISVLDRQCHAGSSRGDRKCIRLTISKY